MKIGVLGTGVVGEAIAMALINKGHHVMMGSRTTDNEKTAAWKKKAGNNANTGTFAEAGLHGELIFTCLSGEYALKAINTVDKENLTGKILIDVTNPLDFAHGMPPRILENLGNSKSLGEEIQKAVPSAFVIKTLNTVNYNLMVDARKVNSGDHNFFFCGNDVKCKKQSQTFFGR